MRSLWQYWKSDISDELIDTLLNDTEHLNWQDTGLGYDGSTENNDYRISQVKWINPIVFPLAKNMVWHYATLANRNAFGFDVDMVHDIQLTKYEAANHGKYDWHIDTFWANPSTYDRKISVVIQLSDPSEYEGGDFLIDQQYEAPNAGDIKKKGSVIVFPSFLRHCVTPVTKGTRLSLVSWVEGPKFK